MAFTFTATVASRGYHVYKTTCWTNAKVGEKVIVELERKKTSLDTDPYACAIRIKNRYFENLITVGHIPREISRHVHFFIKTEGGKVNGHVKSLTYRSSPIPAGGFEILLQLTFSCNQEKTLDIMRGFLNSLHDWSYTGLVDETGDEDIDNNIDGEEIVIP